MIPAIEGLAHGTAPDTASAATRVFACWTSDRHGPLFCRWTAPRPEPARERERARDDIVPDMAAAVELRRDAAD